MDPTSSPNNIRFSTTGFQFDLPPPTFNPYVVLGPWLMGLIIDVSLTGVILTMSLEYWREYAHRDRRRIKTCVVLSGLLATFKSGIVAATVWRKLITGYSSYIIATGPSPWYGRIDPLVAAIMILLAQSFFLLRLKGLMHGPIRLVLVPIVVAMLFGLVGRIAIVAQLFAINEAHDETTGLRWATTAGTVGVMVADLAISSSFCFILIKSKTGMPRTDSLVFRLIVLSWTTTLIPTICGLVMHITYFVGLDESRLYIAFSRMLPKIYVVAMLVTLNMRSQLRNDERFHLSNEHQLSFVIPRSADRSRSRVSPRLGNTANVPCEVALGIGTRMPKQDEDSKPVDSAGISDVSAESRRWTGGESSAGPMPAQAIPATQDTNQDAQS